MDELQKLRERVKLAREKHRAGQKERYRYAKSLGFTAEEATILQNRSKEYIDQLLILKERE